ncbi:MAG: glycosyltransferase [Phycisphaerales bacterium]|nr:glycosyltransferase [Phycisphaerales bacterium]
MVIPALGSDRAELTGAILAAREIGDVVVCLRGAGRDARDAALAEGAAVVEGGIEEGASDAEGWVLLLLPDERPDADFVQSVREVASGADRSESYSAMCRTLFFGRRLRFGGTAGRYLRLRRGGVDFTPWERPRRSSGRLGGVVYRVRAEPAREFVERCIAEGSLGGSAPGRSGVLEFFVRFLLRGGFLDGRAGFHLAMFESTRRHIQRSLTRERSGSFAGEAHDPDTVIGREQARVQREERIRRTPELDRSRGLHPVSVVILTKDEEINIADCLSCLGFSDDIVVYDSFSTDRTVEIAEEFPDVRVVKRRFDNWSSHQNWGVRNIEFKHPWVLYVDADEWVEPDLAMEVMAAADPASPMSAYRMRRKDMFMGRWIRHATLYPTWLVRLFRPEKIRYERLVNPVAIVDGEIDELDGHLIHFPFSKGMDQWFERHNSYSGFEAEEMLKVVAGSRRPLRGLLSRDPNARRAVQKDIFFRLPFRPHIKWMYYMFWKRAWLDGMPGVTYARMQYLYEYMIVIKARERLASRKIEAGGAERERPSRG